MVILDLHNSFNQEIEGLLFCSCLSGSWGLLLPYVINIINYSQSLHGESLSHLSQISLFQLSCTANSGLSCWYTAIIPPNSNLSVDVVSSVTVNISHTIHLAGSSTRILANLDNAYELSFAQTQ